MPDHATIVARTPIGSALARHVPAVAVTAYTRHASVRLVLRVAALLGGFVVLRHFLFTVARLPESAYESPVLLSGLAREAGWAGLAGIAVAVLVLVRYGGLSHPWQAFEHGRTLRTIITLLAAAATWPLSTYGYNFYFDQGHYADRALLVALTLLVWFRPAFVLPYLVMAFTLMWQFGVPDLRAASVFPHKLQILNVLILFASLFLAHALTGTRRKDEFVFLGVCMVAASYWFPALTKIEMNWVMHGGLYKMLPAAYAHGWLTHLDPATIVRFTDLIAVFDWPMRLFVLGVEAACLLFIVRRSVTIGLLIALIIFHLGVFALYGYLFWTWILVDAGLLWLLWRDRHARQIAIYSRAHLCLSVILIAGANYWSAPAKLGWFDTGLTYTFHYEAVGVSGTEYRVPPRFFEPYGDVFTMANFDYLIESHRSLVHPYGITSSHERAVGLDSAHTAQAVFALETAAGRHKYDSELAERFRQFLSRYLNNRNARGAAGELFSAIAAPPQFWSSVRGNVYQGQEPLRELVVYEVTTFFDGNALRELRRVESMRVALTATQATAADATESH